MTKSEQQFADYLDSMDLMWKFEPKAFDLGYKRPKRSGNVTYTPDFYCHNYDTYYEVSASRQALQQSKPKIKLFWEIYPHLKLKISHPDGTPYPFGTPYPLLKVNRMDNLMTINEVCDYIRLKRVTVYKMAQQGRIPAFKVGSNWAFSKKDIDAWLQKNSNQNKGG